MPGLISQIFEAQDGEEQANSQTTSIAGEGETGVQASPEVSLAMSGSHQNADGSSSEWSNETTVGTQVDVEAGAAAAASLTGDTAQDFE